MAFSVTETIQIIERTPAVLHAMLFSFPETLVHANEGRETWSVFDIVGHMIEGEKTDWIPRMNIILTNNDNKQFEPFNRFSQIEANTNKTLSTLLSEFDTLRKQNVYILQEKNLQEEDLQKTGIHPEFGQVTLSQLIATWAVHDLNHIAQICRVISYKYRQETDPWIKYLRILQSHQ